MIRVCTYIMLALLLTGSAYSTKRFLLIYEKQLVIHGSTSWGKFTCKISQTGLQDTLQWQHGDRPYIFFLPVTSFACGNYFLNKDFQNTLKGDEYPRIKVGLLNPQDQGDFVIADILIGLAGKEVLKPKIKLKKVFKDKRQTLVSRLTLQFAEFDLCPPSRLGGLVVVEDAISIDVQVVYR